MPAIGTFVAFICLSSLVLGALRLLQFASTSSKRLRTAICPHLNADNGKGHIRPGVLLVIAHPDDEAMFFSPCLTHLRRFADVHLLCLSNGGYDGLGKVREKELLNSASVFGIPHTNVTQIDDPSLPDGPKSRWAVGTVKSYISSAAQSMQRCDAILSFDDKGVSGHINHIDVHFGVIDYIKSQREALRAKGLILRTSNIAMKYSSTASALFLPLGKRDTVLIGNTSDLFSAWRAMKAHASQWVWFRRLFVVFSHYTFINEITIIPPRAK